MATTINVQYVNGEIVRDWQCHNCGESVQCWDSQDVECECGAFYNGFGQKLRHPEEWMSEWNDSYLDD